MLKENKVSLGFSAIPSLVAEVQSLGAWYSALLGVAVLDWRVATYTVHRFT